MHRLNPARLLQATSGLARTFSLAAGLGIASMAGLGGTTPAQAQTPAQVPQSPPAQQTPANAGRGLPDFTDLVEQVGPAVVNIRTTEHLKAQAAAQLDPNIEEFFRRFGIPLPGPRDPKDPRAAPGDDDPQRRGVGSGFILSPDGFVMTNAHVVEGADELIVTLTDKREFKARLIGSDTRTDVAVVKIEGANLPFVRIGNVDRLKVGEWVIAIGSPFDLDNTVTAGIVSAKQRETGDYLPLIQTDVAINPGNSGGPLINMRGEVVGINSQILSPSGGYAGISLAIPIDEAIRVSDQLRAQGRVVRGRIGVQIAAVSREVAESIGLGKPKGALVESVQTGLPAEKAGIEAGDVITQVEGRAVERSSDLPRMIGMMKPGARATLQIFRKGAFKNVSVAVAEFEPEKTKAELDAAAEAAPKAALGLKVSEIGDAQKAELRIKGGVRVDAAEDAAARAGLRAGDVILRVGSTDVTSAAQFAALLAKIDKTKPVSLLVRRGDQATYLLVRPGK